MSKERAKDKGGTLAGKSKSYNNNRGTNGKIMNSDNTTSEAPSNIINQTGHRRG